MSIVITGSVWLLTSLVVAAISGSPRGARIGVGTALATLAIPFFLDASPLLRFITAAAFVWLALRAADLAVEPHDRGAAFRWLHLLVVFDSRRIEPRRSTIDHRAFARMLIAFALSVIVVAVLQRADTLSDWPWRPLLWLVLGIGLFAIYELSVSVISILTGFIGLRVPPINDVPYRSRSLSEFWARRWNLEMSRMLNGLAFKPCARCKIAAIGIFASFALSGIVHGYTMAASLGVEATVMWIAFFLLQPVAMLVERRLGVRRWPPPAARAWTLGILLLTLPLLAEPLLGFLS